MGLLDPILFSTPIYYYLWIAGLTTAIASSLLFFRLGISIRKSLVGKIIFYLSFAYGLMAGVITLQAFEHPVWTPITAFSFFILLMAGIITLYVVSIGFRVYKLIEVHTTEVYKPKILFIPITIGISLGGLGLIRFLLNNSFLLDALDGFSVQTCVASGLLGVGLVYVLFRENNGKRYKSIFCGISVIVIALISLIGIWFNIENLYMPFEGGGLSTPTAIAFIGMGIVLLILHKGSNSKLLITMLSLLSLVIIAVSFATLGYLLEIPELYSPQSAARMSPPTIIMVYSYSITLLVSLWKRI